LKKDEEETKEIWKRKHEHEEEWDMRTKGLFPSLSSMGVQ